MAHCRETRAMSVIMQISKKKKAKNLNAAVVYKLKVFDFIASVSRNLSWV